MPRCSTLDPVVAYFSIPEVDYINFAKRFQAQKRESKAPIELILADGSTHAQSGQLDFTDRASNPATGTLTLRAVFPNPDGLLRPGMNTRVRIVSRGRAERLVGSSRLVTELLGKQFASVVLAGDRIEQRPIRTGARIGELWLVEEGLKAGERIVVEGLQKARPGTVVKPLDAATAGKP